MNKDEVNLTERYAPRKRARRKVVRRDPKRMGGQLLTEAELEKAVWFELERHQRGEGMNPVVARLIVDHRRLTEAVSRWQAVRLMENNRWYCFGCLMELQDRSHGHRPSCIWMECHDRRG